MSADDRYRVLSDKWKRRLDGVAMLGERTLFVSPEEDAEIREMEQLRIATEPPEVTARREYEEMLNLGRIGNLLATPVVVDVAEAERQRNAMMERSL